MSFAIVYSFVRDISLDRDTTRIDHLIELILVSRDHVVRALKLTLHLCSNQTRGERHVPPYDELFGLCSSLINHRLMPTRQDKIREQSTSLALAHSLTQTLTLPHSTQKRCSQQITSASPSDVTSHSRGSNFTHVDVRSLVLPFTQTGPAKGRGEVRTPSTRTCPSSSASSRWREGESLGESVGRVDERMSVIRSV